MTGFEPATSCSQSRRSSQAELHPDPKGIESRYPREERQQAVSRENKLEEELWVICVNNNPILCSRSILDIRGASGVMKVEHDDPRTHF